LNCVRNNIMTRRSSISTKQRTEFRLDRGPKTGPGASGGTQPERGADVTANRSGPRETGSHTPAQRRRADRRVPKPQQLVIGAQQRDRAAGHVKRRDVVTDQVARNRDPCLSQ